MFNFRVLYGKYEGMTKPLGRHAGTIVYLTPRSVKSYNTRPKSAITYNQARDLVRCTKDQFRVDL